MARTSPTAIATTKAPDMYAALDLMEEKVERQLRRLKSKLQDHHPKHGKEKSVSAGADEPSYQDIVNEEMNPG